MILVGVSFYERGRKCPSCALSTAIAAPAQELTGRQSPLFLFIERAVSDE